MAKKVTKGRGERRTPAKPSPRELLREAFDAMVIVTSWGQPCYRTGNGIPMGMPKRVERKVRAALLAERSEATPAVPPASPSPVSGSPETGLFKRAILEPHPWGLDEIVAEGGIAHIERMTDRSFFANLPGIRLWFHSAAPIHVNYEMEVLPGSEVELRTDYEPDEDEPNPVDVANAAYRWVQHDKNCGAHQPGVDVRDACTCGLNSWIDDMLKLEGGPLHDGVPLSRRHSNGDTK